ERVAVIVTTNLRFAEWSHVMAGDERMSAALLDRLTHRAHILEFRGTSFRFRQQLGLARGGSATEVASPAAEGVTRPAPLELESLGEAPSAPDYSPAPEGEEPPSTTPSA